MNGLPSCHEWPGFLPCMAGLLHAAGLVPPATTAPASSHCVSVKSLGYMFSSDSPQTSTHIPCRVSFFYVLDKFLGDKAHTLRRSMVSAAFPCSRLESGR